MCFARKKDVKLARSPQIHTNKNRKHLKNIKIVIVQIKGSSTVVNKFD